MRIHKADWHNIHCDESNCRRAYCRSHRRIFWVCQDFEWDPENNFYGGGADCAECSRDARIKKYQQWTQHQQGQVVRHAA